MIMNRSVLALALALTASALAQPVSPAPVNTGSRADLNSDGYIDGADLAVLIDILSGTNRDPIVNARADFNADGRVDHNDLLPLLEMLGGGRGACPNTTNCCRFE